jgi:hypothetical protein
MRTALTIAVAAVLLALAGCSSGAVENAATTSASSPAPSSTAPARTHQVVYLYSTPGVDSPYTYVDDKGSTVGAHTGAVVLSKTVNLPEGRIAMVAGDAADGVSSSSCSIKQDGREVATQTSTDPKNPASCSYIVH